tara:strand:+ start:17004 stop:17624 length:621 start_codon:yes stop_codon:yes gene_type:complete
MTYSINSIQALAIARNDLTIFREINAIMEKIIADTAAGLYSSSLSDGTTMTEATPNIIIVGEAVNPTIVDTPTFIIAGVTITLGTTGTNLNSVIADINDAEVTGLVASKDSELHLVLTYTSPAAEAWTVTVGAGTANGDLGFNTVTHSATNPSSTNYYSVWTGATADRAISDQMSQVIQYFETLGYTIDRQANPATNKTIKWTISY